MDLQLKKGGKLFAKEWDFDENDFIDDIIYPEEFIYHIHDTICFDKDVKLRDFFLMVAENIEICSIITGCPFIEELVLECLDTPKKSKNNISALHISWNPYILNNEDGEHIENFIVFQGIGDKEYQLDLIAINKLSLYPIILDENYALKTEDEEIILQTNKKYTLINILRTIIDELSHMGPPEMREFTFAELKKQSNKEFLLTQEELDKKFKERIKDNKKLCINCEEDTRSPCFGKPENICPSCYQKIKEN